MSDTDQPRPPRRADEANAAGWDPDQPLVAETNPQADGATSDGASRASAPSRTRGDRTPPRAAAATAAGGPTGST